MQPYSIDPLLEDEGLPKPKWKRRLAWGVGCALLVLGLLAWGVNTELFMRTFVLSKLGDSLNADIQYKNAEWSPSRELVLHDLSLSPESEKPCLTAKRLRVSFNWRDLWDGQMEFGVIEIAEPVFTIAVDENGRSNWDPLFDRESTGGDPKPVWIRQFTLQKGQLKYTRQTPGGGEERLVVSHLELRGEDLGTGREGKLNLAAGVQFARRLANAATESVFHGTISADTEQSLALSGTPTALNTKAKLAIQQSTGQFEFADGLEVNFDGTINEAVLKTLQLQFHRQSKLLGNLAASGEFNLREGAGQLEVIATKIDRGLLNFVGSPWGLDFHGTVLNSTNAVTFNNFGARFQLQGSVRATPVHLSCQRVPYPTLDSAGMTYSIEADFIDRLVNIYRFHITGDQAQQTILRANTLAPMTFAWGTQNTTAPDSRLKLQLANADLADWRAWLGNYATQGTAAGSWIIDVRQAGRDIELTGAGNIDGFRIPLGETTRDLGQFRINTRARLTDFRRLQLTGLDASAGDRLRPIIRFQGNATGNLRQQTLNGNGTLEGELPVLLQWFPQPNLTTPAGRARLKGAFNVSDQAQSFSGTIDLENVTGHYKKIAFTNLTSHAEAKVSLSEKHALRIDTLAGGASLAGQPLTKKIDVTGDWNLKTGQADLKGIFIEQLNLNALRSIIPLPATVGGNLDGNLSLTHSRGKTTTLKGSFTLANAIIPRLPAGLTAKADQLDLALNWQNEGHFVFDLRQFKLQLTDAANQSLAALAGSGRCDPSAGTFALALAPGQMAHPVLESLLGKKLDGGKVANQMPVQFSRDANGMFHFAGPIEANGIRLGERAMDADLKLDVAFRGGSDWRVVARDSSGTFRVGDQPAGSASVSGEYDAKTGIGKVVATVAKVDHAVVALLPAAWRGGVAMEAGTIAEVKIDGAIREGVFDGNVDVALDGAKLVDAAGRLPAEVMDVRHAMTGRVSLGKAWVFQLTKNTGTISRGGAVIGEYDLPGSWVSPDLFLDVKKFRLAPALTGHVLKLWLPNRRLRAGTFEVSPSEVRLNRDGSGRFAGIVSFKNFAIPGVGGTKDTPLNATFEVEAIAQANRVFQLRQFVAHLPVTQRAANQATLTGKIDLSQPTAPGGELVLQAEAIDLTALMEIFRERQAATNLAAGGLGLAFRKLVLKTDVKKVFWRDVNATGVRGEFYFDKGLVKVHPLEMRLLGAPLMMDGWVIPNGANTQFGFQLSCDRLPLTPIARQFNPALPAAVDYGELTMHTHVRADAITGDKMRRTLTIRGIEGAAEHLVIRSAVLGRRKPGEEGGGFGDLFSLIGIPLMPVDVVTGGILSEFITFKIEELQQAFVSDVELQLHVDDGVVHHRLTAKGADFRYDTTGRIRLAATWRESPLDQKITIWLAGKHSKKLLITGGLLVEDDQLYPLVESIPLRGTLGKPKLDETALIKIGLGTMRILGKPAETIEGILELPLKILEIFD